jgi:hypothetical protein
VNSQIPAQIVAGVLGLLVGGFLAELIGSALSLVVAISGLAAAGARSVAALWPRTEQLSSAQRARRLDRATAIGFLVGLAVSTFVLVLDAIVRP